MDTSTISPTDYVVEQSRLRQDKKLGYIYFLDKNHPLGGVTGKVYYHRHVASVKYNRWIDSNEHVHHIDGDKVNNSQDNLVVLSGSEHCKLEQAIKGNIREYRPCARCGKPTSNYRYCSDECVSIARMKCERPTAETLLDDLSKMPCVAVGKKYGVSDHSILDWLKDYGIVYHRYGPRKAKQ